MQQSDLAQQFPALGDNELGGCGGGRRTQVSGEIGDGDIGFMAHGRDNRDPGGGDRPSDRFAVESGKIFKRASAAREQNDFGVAMKIGKLESADDLRDGAFALDLHRKDDQRDARKAPSCDVEDIMNHRPGWRGDDGDLGRKKREGLFPCRIEEPFGGKFFLKLLEGELERPKTCRFDVLKDDLVRAARLIDCNPAEADDAQPVFELKAKLPGLLPKENRGDLCCIVLKRKIRMPRCRPSEIGDFPCDPDHGEALLENLADPAGEFRYRQDGSSRLLRKGLGSGGVQEGRVFTRYRHGYNVR